MINDETFDYILEEVRLHGDADLAADRAGVDRRYVRRLITYAGDDPELLDASLALELAQAEGKSNQPHYAKQLFLAALERHASVPEAIAAQKWYSRSAFDTWKRKDPEFELQWNEAIERAVDKLRREAWRRGAEGFEEPVVHLGQYCYEFDEETGDKRQVTVRKFSDGLLTTLLKRYDPGFRERMGVDLTASVDGGLTQDAAVKALGQLSGEELAALTKLLAIAEEDTKPDDT